MIFVQKVPEPSEFDKKVRKPGQEWLSANEDASRPKPFWSECADALADGFQQRCGYAAMLDPTGGTVDHYLSFKNYPHLAYEWDNYRFASATLNAS